MVTVTLKLLKLLFQQKPMENWVLNIEEGVVLEPNAAIGLIDTIQLYLNEQLLAAKTTIFQNQKCTIAN
jgi:hypothetical protein